MSTNPHLLTRPAPTPEETGVRLALLALALLLLGPPTLAGMLWLALRRRDFVGRAPHLLLGGAALAGLGLVWLAWPLYRDAYAALLAPLAGGAVPDWRRAGILWTLTLPLAPAGACVLALGERTMRLFRRQTLAEQLADERRWQQAREERLSRRASAPSCAATPCRNRSWPARAAAGCGSPRRRSTSTC